MTEEQFEIHVQYLKAIGNALTTQLMANKNVHANFFSSAANGFLDADRAHRKYTENLKERKTK